MSARLLIAFVTTVLPIGQLSAQNAPDTIVHCYKEKADNVTDGFYVRSTGGELTWLDMNSGTFLPICSMYGNDKPSTAYRNAAPVTCEKTVTTTFYYISWDQRLAEAVYRPQRRLDMDRVTGKASYIGADGVWSYYICKPSSSPVVRPQF